MMAESSDDGEHSDWTLLQADNADALLQTQVDTEDEEKEKEPSTVTMVDQVSTIESSGIDADLVDEDGDEEARSDTTASIRSHSSNFCHIHADELLDAEVRSEASADSISVIPDDQDLHMDLSNFSSFSSTNCELPTDLNVTRQRAYTHVPNRKLNITLNLVLALSFTMVVGLGIGHFLGWSTKWEQTVATIQTMKVQELHDDLIECMSRPVTQDDDNDNVCTGEFQQDSDACQATADNGVDEELLEEFNELKRSLHVRQQELESALNTIEEAQMKEKSSLDRLRQLEEENQELKSLVDEEMANDQMETEMADKLRSENVQLKEDLARLREELAAEMAEDDQFGQTDNTNDAVVGSFREQMNQLEIENADLRRVIARLRYVDHPNVVYHEQDSEATVTTPDSEESMDSGNPETPPTKDASLGDFLHGDDLNSIIEDFLTITKQKYYRDGHSHISLMEGLKAYKSVFAKIASMSSSLNSEQIIDKVETTLRDSLDTLEKMGLDIKGRFSEIWVSNKQEDVAQEEEEKQQIMDDGGYDEVDVAKGDTDIPQQDDSVNNEANSNDGKGDVKSEKENIGMDKGNEKEKENKISKGKESSKILKEQNYNKASKEKEKTKISEEKDINKVSKEKNSNKFSKEKENKVSKEKDKVSKEKENKVSKEKDGNKVSKEKDGNKVSKEKDNNKVSKERNDKVSKEKESKMAKNKENSNVPKEGKKRESKKNENKIQNEKDSNKNPETSKKREKATDTKHDRRQRGNVKAVKNSKDNVKHKDKKEAMSKTQNKEDKQHTKKVNEDTDSKNKRNNKKSNKSSENSTESSGGMWMFERANQRETKRNKDREAEWYFERKHHERKETESKKYENRKKKHNEKDDEDDDKMKHSKDWEKEKKKSSEGKNHRRTRDHDEDDADDRDEHGMNWHTKMVKNFQKYKKHFKQRWTSFKKNWDIPKVQHPSSYFQHFYKSQ